MLIWAGSGIAVQHSLLYVRPFTLMIIRFTIAILLMLSVGVVVNRYQKSKVESQKSKAELDLKQSSLLSLQLIAKKDIPLFLLAGTMQPVLYFIFETYCYRSLSSPTIAEALLSTAPLIAPWLALLFLLLRELHS